VLDLLKKGYSNRDIAEELQVSLAGAKYHVSEIISKLGVSSREEAASWDAREDRRHAIVPAFLTSRLDALLPNLSLKLAGSLALAAAAIVAAVSLAGDSDAGNADGPPAAAAPSPTPDFPCEKPGESCFRILHVDLASWEEAASYATVPLLEPTYIPDGYEHDHLTYSYSDPPIERLGIYTSVVSASFIGPDGDSLIVNQGFGTSLDDYAFRLAPDEYRGRVGIDGLEVSWVNGGPLWEERSDGWHAIEEWDLTSLGSYTLTWSETGTGPIAWERSPDGDFTYHRTGLVPGYLIHAEDLPLEELIKVAESMLVD
jgi:hypothetical protein